MSDRRISTSCSRRFLLSLVHRTAGFVVLALALGPSHSHGDDYSTIAAAIASPLPNSREKLKDSYSDPQVMLRLERARQTLQSKSKVEADLADTRRSVLEDLETCRRSWQEIRRLDPELPDLETIALQTLIAAPGIIQRESEAGNAGRDPLEKLGETLFDEGINSIVDAWNASRERKRYRESYRSARAESLALAAVASKRSTGKPAESYGIGLATNLTEDAVFVDEALPGGPAAKAGLRQGDELLAVDGKQIKKAVGKRTIVDESVFADLRGPRGSEVQVTFTRNGKAQTVTMKREYVVHSSLLEIDFDGSWDAIFTQDILALKNISGSDLTNCTLLVTLDGIHGETKKPGQRQHLHYVEKWPHGESRYAWYRSSTAGGVAADESLDRVQRVTIELFSDEYRDKVTHEYAGTADFGNDLDRYVDLIKKNQKFELSVINQSFHSDAGVQLQHSGSFRFISDAEITVTLARGKDIRKMTWSRSESVWKSGSWSGRSLTDASFNGLTPSRVEVEMAFPGTSKKLNYQWNVSK